MRLKETNRACLSLWQVVIIGIAYMTPMTVFDTFGIVSNITEGRVPLAYLLALAAVLLTAISYGRMVRLHPSSGSAYTYAKKVCGNKTGFIVGWSSLLDYVFLPMINSLLAGIYLQTLLPDVPVWFSILVFTSLVTFVNCCNIKTLANANFIFVGIPVILMGVFIYFVIHNLLRDYGDSHIFTTQPLFNGHNSIIPLISGAAVLCFSFLGFDAVTTLTDETKSPVSTIPKAVFYTALSGGCIFFVAAWFIQLYFPDNSNNNLTHRFFGYLHPENKNPVYCILLIGLISLTSIFIQLDTAVSLISFGALVAFSAVNLSVIIHFAIVKKGNGGLKNIFHNIALPLAGLSCVAVMWVNLSFDAFILGLTWATLGLGWIVYCNFTKKEVAISE